MKHARNDYNRIQDPFNLIPFDEPVFLLRAQDVNAPATLEHWADLSEKSGVDPKMVSLIRNQAIEMRGWQNTHGFKVPDL